MSENQVKTKAKKIKRKIDREKAREREIDR